MLTTLLIAQLVSPGPYCGDNFGTMIRPEDAPFTGCFLPSWSGSGGAVIREDPYSPGGYRATPVPEQPQYRP
jgi:hypothetical protein